MLPVARRYRSRRVTCNHSSFCRPTNSAPPPGIVSFFLTGDVPGTYFRVRGKERMTGMSRESDWMKEEQRTDIRDGYGWIDQTQRTNSSMNSHSHDYLLQKVGDPRPFIGVGGVPSLLFLFSPAFCFCGEAASPSPPRSVRGISSKLKDKKNPINSPSPAIRYSDDEI